MVPESDNHRPGNSSITPPTTDKASASSVNAAEANIEKISLDERDGRTGIAHLLISVTDRVHLARVIKRLRILKGVLRISRQKA